MHAVDRGFLLGSIISVIGFVALGFGYLVFDRAYIINQGVERGLFKDADFQKQLGVPAKDIGKLEARIKELKGLATPDAAIEAEKIQDEIDTYRKMVVRDWKDEIHRDTQKYKDILADDAVLKKSRD